MVHRLFIFIELFVLSEVSFFFAFFFCNFLKFPRFFFSFFFQGDSVIRVS